MALNPITHFNQFTTHLMRDPSQATASSWHGVKGNPLATTALALMALAAYTPVAAAVDSYNILGTVKGIVCNGQSCFKEYCYTEKICDLLCGSLVGCSRFCKIEEFCELRI